MGRRKTIIKPSALPETTFKDFCACCNKKFGSDLRKTRKFMINQTAAEEEVGITPPTNDNPEQERTGGKIIDVHSGLEEILTWRHRQSFVGVMDPNLGLCCSCGLIVAKLYSALKLFDNAKVELSFLNKFVNERLYKDDKATDTDQDTLDDAAEAAGAGAQIDTGTGLDDYYYPEEVEEEKKGRTRVIDNSSRAYHCEYCQAGFDKNANLTRHLLLTHGVGNREKEYQCGVCGKEYYFSYLLKNHELIHGEQRPFVCKVQTCKASFKNKLGLHAHVKFYHRRTRPYKCRYCTKDFKDARNHRNHEHFVHNIPLGCKPHVCEFCGERFKRLSSLPGHLKRKCRKNPDRDRVLSVQGEEAAEASTTIAESITIVEVEEGVETVPIPGDQMEVEEEITLGLLDH